MPSTSHTLIHVESGFTIWQNCYSFILVMLCGPTMLSLKKNVWTCQLNYVQWWITFDGTDYCCDWWWIHLRKKRFCLQVFAAAWTVESILWIIPMQVQWHEWKFFVLYVGDKEPGECHEVKCSYWVPDLYCISVYWFWLKGVEESRVGK